MNIDPANKKAPGEKSHLAPPEPCDICGKMIGPKSTAYVIDNLVHCFKCKAAKNKERRALEFEVNKARYTREEQARKEREWQQSATERQTAYLLDLGEVPPVDCTKREAWVLIEEAIPRHRIDRFIRGLWERRMPHRFRYYGIVDEQIRDLAEHVRVTYPGFAAEISDKMANSSGDRYCDCGRCSAEVRNAILDVVKVYFQDEIADAKSESKDE